MRGKGDPSVSLTDDSSPCKGEPKETDCHDQFENWSRNDRSQEVQQKAGRDDVGSESSAASGRRSEMSEWPRSKLGASAVRQRRNFGHRNRTIVPYGAFGGRIS